MSTPLNSSLIKAFEILKLIEHERPEISSNIVVSELGMNNATAHRFLLTLESIGMLVSYKRGYFSLGPRLTELGNLAVEINPLSVLIQPILESVSRNLNESVMSCRLGRTGPVCTSVATSTDPIGVNIRVGTALKMFESAQGKVWLASMDPREQSSWLESDQFKTFEKTTNIDSVSFKQELSEIKVNGYGQNFGGIEPDIAAVSVPVIGEGGKMIVSLSVFGLLRRFDESTVKYSIKELQQAAEQIKKSVVRFQYQTLKSAK